eukprot:TRINITY_DN9466_c0_g2_i2.p1 TRINITY_DN9466_c0_g2~~TRINITY_DN9466_c0_g2_i2.p1  ORF type:complete len:109 (-),score=23.60 TRINITY_DN9466_c0_g2_i2:2-328(-)
MVCPSQRTPPTMPSADGLSYAEDTTYYALYWWSVLCRRHHLLFSPLLMVCPMQRTPPTMPSADGTVLHRGHHLLCPLLVVCPMQKTPPTMPSTDGLSYAEDTTYYALY